jgi:hypothetical protein
MTSLLGGTLNQAPASEAAPPDEKPKA